MHVVLDANVICADFRMRGQALGQLLAAADRGRISLIVPEVVVREVVSVFARTFREHKPRLERELAQFRRMGLLEAQDGPELPRNVEDAAAAYESDLRWLLLESEVNIPPLPDVTHDRILSRIFDERKPMDRGEKGYRDTLLWETVLEIASIVGPVVLLSQNAKDFGEDDRLASDLREDLKAAGFAPDLVSLYSDVGQFVTDVVAPLTPGAWTDKINEIIETSELLPEIGEYLRGFLDYGFPVDLEGKDAELFLEASVASAGTVAWVGFEGASESAHGMPTATFTCEVDADVEATIPIEEFQEIQEWERPEPLETDDIRGVVRVRLPRVLLVTGRIPFVEEFERPFGDLLEIEVIALGSDSPTVRPQRESLF